MAALVDLLLRVIGFAPPRPVKFPEQYEKFQPDSELIWVLKPGWQGFEINGAPVRTNRRGLRGPEITALASEGVTRVLFLGDSVTFGHGLKQGLTIPERLQDALGRKQIRSEVINAGVPGYSTFQSRLYFQRAGRDLHPDIVLLGFCLNDVTERYHGLASYGGENVFMMGVDTSAGMSWPRRVWRWSAIRQALVTFLKTAAKRQEADRQFQRGFCVR